MQKEANHFHALSTEQVLKQLDTTEKGITTEKAKQLETQFGKNKLPEKEQTSKIVLLLRQLKNLMTYILLAAALISFSLDRILDTYVITGIIFVNILIGYLQESKAEKAIQALQKMIVEKAKVLRDSKIVQIPSKELVPGDIIILEEGDKIPADARLIEISDFQTVESSLTGESTPVEKILKPLPQKTILADRKNMVFLGTFVASGSAKAVVTTIGAQTTIGKLAESIKQIKPRKTHFQKKTDTLAKQLALIAAIGATIIFIVGYHVRNIPIKETFLFTIASLVSGIPEGLPAVLATVLAIGSYRMAKRNAIIRHRYATETLSVVDVILTDKTGTLTENTMSIQEIVLPGQTNIKVTGTGWTPKGEFIQNQKQIIPLTNQHLSKLLHIASYCNNSTLDKTEEGKIKIVGDPTEAALLILAEKAGIKKEVLLQREQKIDEMPFNPGLKYRASLSTLSEKANQKQIYVIGAPEAVIKNSTYVLKKGRKAKLTTQDKTQIEKQFTELTNKAMRVLALAYKDAPKNLKELDEKDTAELTLVGIVGMSDPPRPEVKEALQKAKQSGIKVLMATGDHKNTAVAIAKEIGMKNPEKAITGEELEALSEKQFQRAVNKYSIFARLSPNMKLRLTKALQDQGHTVAVTGDGVNDAPALKQAEIGIAMGQIGTDVAREASEVVLADDNFASIINAVEEGRTVFINTRQTTFFLVTTGLAEHTAIIATMLLGFPLPLLPTQVLWLNIVTGGVTDVALSTERPHHETMKEKPRKQTENLLNKEVLPNLLMITGIMVILTVLIFIHFMQFGEVKARSAAFTALCLTQLFNVFNMRSLKNSIFKIGPFSNKYTTAALIFSTGLLIALLYVPALQNIFNFAALSLKEFLTILAASSLVLWSGETYKFFKHRKSNHSKKTTDANLK